MRAQWTDQFDAVVCRHLSMPGTVDGLTPNLVLADRGLDSLDTINLLVALGDAFGVTFPDESLAATTVETPGALWSVLAVALPRTAG